MCKPSLCADIAIVRKHVGHIIITFMVFLYINSIWSDMIYFYRYTRKYLYKLWLIKARVLRSEFLRQQVGRISASRTLCIIILPHKTSSKLAYLDVRRIGAAPSSVRPVGLGPSVTDRSGGRHRSVTCTGTACAWTKNGRRGDGTAWAWQRDSKGRQWRLFTRRL